MGFYTKIIYIQTPSKWTTLTTPNLMHLLAPLIASPATQICYNDNIKKNNMQLFSIFFLLNTERYNFLFAPPTLLEYP